MQLNSTWLTNRALSANASELLSRCSRDMPCHHHHGAEMGHSLESLATGSTTCSLDTGQRQVTNSYLQLKTRTLKPLLLMTKISPLMTGAKQPVMRLMLPVGLWWENATRDAIGEGAERLAMLSVRTFRPIITGTPDIWTSPFSRICIHIHIIS